MIKKWNMRAAVFAMLSALVVSNGTATSQGVNDLSPELEAVLENTWRNTKALRDRASLLFVDWKIENELLYETAIKEVWCTQRSLSFALFTEASTETIAYREGRVEKAEKALSAFVSTLNEWALANTRDLDLEETVYVAHLVDIEHEGFVLGLRTGLRMDYEKRPFPGLCE